MTYFTVRSNWVIEWGETVTKSFNGENFQVKDKIDWIIVFFVLF